eukprot:g4743.t1
MKNYNATSKDRNVKRLRAHALRRFASQRKKKEERRTILNKELKLEEQHLEVAKQKFIELDASGSGTLGIKEALSLARWSFHTFKPQGISVFDDHPPEFVETDDGFLFRNLIKVITAKEKKEISFSEYKEWFQRTMREIGEDRENVATEIRSQVAPGEKDLVAGKTESKNKDVQGSDLLVEQAFKEYKSRTNSKSNLNREQLEDYSYWLVNRCTDNKKMWKKQDYPEEWVEFIIQDMEEQSDKTPMTDDQLHIWLNHIVNEIIDINQKFKEEIKNTSAGGSPSGRRRVERRALRRLLNREGKLQRPVPKKEEKNNSDTTKEDKKEEHHGFFYRMTHRTKAKKHDKDEKHKDEKHNDEKHKDGKHDRDEKHKDEKHKDEKHGFLSSLTHKKKTPTSTANNLAEPTEKKESNDSDRKKDVDKNTGVDTSENDNANAFFDVEALSNVLQNQFEASSKIQASYRGYAVRKKMKGKKDVVGDLIFGKKSQIVMKGKADDIQNATAISATNLKENDSQRRRVSSVIINEVNSKDNTLPNKVIEKTMNDYERRKSEILKEHHEDQVLQIKRTKDKIEKIESSLLPHINAAFLNSKLSSYDGNLETSAEEELKELKLNYEKIIKQLKMDHEEELKHLHYQNRKMLNVRKEIKGHPLSIESQHKAALVQMGQTKTFLVKQLKTMENDHNLELSNIMNDHAAEIESMEIENMNVINKLKESHEKALNDLETSLTRKYERNNQILREEIMAMKEDMLHLEQCSEEEKRAREIEFQERFTAKEAEIEAEKDAEIKLIQAKHDEDMLKLKQEMVGNHAEDLKRWTKLHEQELADHRARAERSKKAAEDAAYAQAHAHANAIEMKEKAYERAIQTMKKAQQDAEDARISAHKNVISAMKAEFDDQISRMKTMHNNMLLEKDRMLHEEMAEHEALHATKHQSELDKLSQSHQRDVEHLQRRLSDTHEASLARKHSVHQLELMKLAAMKDSELTNELRDIEQTHLKVLDDFRKKHIEDKKDALQKHDIYLGEKHALEIEELNKKYLNEIDEINRKHEIALHDVEKEHSSKYSMLESKHSNYLEKEDERLKKLNAEHELVLQNLKTEHSKVLESTHREHLAAHDQLKLEHARLLQETRSSHTQEKEQMYLTSAVEMENLRTKFGNMYDEHEHEKEKWLLDRTKMIDGIRESRIAEVEGLNKKMEEMINSHAKEIAKIHLEHKENIQSLHEKMSNMLAVHTREKQRMMESFSKEKKLITNTLTEKHNALVQEKSKEIDNIRRDMIEMRKHHQQDRDMLLRSKAETVEEMNNDFSGTVEELHTQQDHLHSSLRMRHAKRVEDLRLKHEKDVEDITNEHLKRVQQIHKDHQERIEKLKEQHKIIHENHLNEIEKIHFDYGNRIDLLEQENQNKMEEEKKKRREMRELHLIEMKKLQEQHGENVKLVSEEHKKVTLHHTNTIDNLHKSYEEKLVAIHKDYDMKFRMTADEHKRMREEHSKHTDEIRRKFEGKLLEKEQEVAELQNKYEEEIEKIQEEKREMIKEKQNEIYELNALKADALSEKQVQIDFLKAQKEQEIKRLKTEMAIERDDLQNSTKSYVAEFNTKLEERRQALKLIEKNAIETTRKNSKMNDVKEILKNHPVPVILGSMRLLNIKSSDFDVNARLGFETSITEILYAASQDIHLDGAEVKITNVSGENDEGVQISYRIMPPPGMPIQMCLSTVVKILENESGSLQNNWLLDLLTREMPQLNGIERLQIPFETIDHRKGNFVLNVRDMATQMSKMRARLEGLLLQNNQDFNEETKSFQSSPPPLPFNTPTITPQQSNVVDAKRGRFKYKFLERYHQRKKKEEEDIFQIRFDSAR